MTIKGAEPDLRVIDVAGSHYDIGRQHGEAVRALAPRIRAAAERHLAELPPQERAARADDLAALRRALERDSPATLDQIAGLAQGLDLAPELLYGAATASYAWNLMRSGGARADEGCTTWAASGAATWDGQPLLVKNRDYRSDHLPLQCVIRARPETGLPWCAVTSAGAPGVYSSGMNAAGLAIADTHVPSRDLGPGLPRYSLMLHVLEEHETVVSALAYLASVPMMGTGNLILADATGALAVVECGYRAYGISRRQGGTLVATNHFVSAALQDAYLPGSWPDAAANSRGRYAVVQEALATRLGRIDAAFARELMAHHAGPLESICVHRREERQSETISCVIFRPADRVLEICHGLPCTASYQTIPVVAPA